MTKIDENYMDIKPQINMHISEGWRAYRHDRLFIEVYYTFWHKFGCHTHLFNINLFTKLSDVFGVALQCKWRYFLRKIFRGSLSLETHNLRNLSTRQIKFRFFSMK